MPRSYPMPAAAIYVVPDADAVGHALHSTVTNVLRTIVPVVATQYFPSDAVTQKPPAHPVHVLVHTPKASGVALRLANALLSRITLATAKGHHSKATQLGMVDFGSRSVSLSDNPDCVIKDADHLAQQPSAGCRWTMEFIGLLPDGSSVVIGKVTSSDTPPICVNTSASSATRGHFHFIEEALLTNACDALHIALCIEVDHSLPTTDSTHTQDDESLNSTNTRRRDSSSGNIFEENDRDTPSMASSDLASTTPSSRASLDEDQPTRRHYDIVTTTSMCYFTTLCSAVTSPSSSWVALKNLATGDDIVGVPASSTNNFLRRSMRDSAVVVLTNDHDEWNAEGSPLLNWLSSRNPRPTCTTTMLLHQLALVKSETSTLEARIGQLSRQYRAVDAETIELRRQNTALRLSNDSLHDDLQALMVRHSGESDAMRMHIQSLQSQLKEERRKNIALLASGSCDSQSRHCCDGAEKSTKTESSSGHHHRLRGHDLHSVIREKEWLQLEVGELAQSAEAAKSALFHELFLLQEKLEEMQCKDATKPPRATHSTQTALPLVDLLPWRRN